MDEATELAKAEEWARWAAVHDDWSKNRELMGVLLAEYDRLRRVVEAATAYVAYEDGGGTRDGYWHQRKHELWIALAGRVREAGDGS